MRYDLRPLEPWIGKFTASRRESPFTATWTATLQLLDREISMLGGRRFVMQIDVAPRHIRLDGELHARAVALSPAVRISFASRHGPLTYAADQFTRWQDNVRAIALSLEALRKVDRYGVAGAGEQYRGWTAIDSRPAQMTRDQAAEFIANVAGYAGIPAGIMVEPHVLTRYYREAAKRAHPDVTGDDGDTMARLNVARDLLLNGRSP